MIGFIIGVFAGGILGVVIMALMAAAKGWDEEMTEKGGQTIVHLKHGDDRAEVGIEELEEEQ